MGQRLRVKSDLRTREADAPLGKGTGTELRINLDDIRDNHTRAIQGGDLQVQLAGLLPVDEIADFNPELRLHIGEIGSYLRKPLHEIYPDFIGLVTIIPAIDLHPVSSLRAAHPPKNLFLPLDEHVQSRIGMHDHRAGRKRIGLLRPDRSHGQAGSQNEDGKTMKSIYSR